ncbi:HAMP domain-containing sensor histidine kinase [Aquamicrobium sp. LC103]|uniref:sensor histidine kinase n=1 Tax=Aquamicrobium sp. LC103 TaxID=1120658 RepID=UPI00069B33A9|nr:HAMP domain-containing sensor histidine kinase [Aquamicrobium sp. LC103]TKT78210.1 HAMP domain-containing histidine kinase [Aquamicrobium sp. LC103]
MLDLKTVLVVTLATASLQAFVWAVVSMAWRSLAEFKFFAAGLSAIAAGVSLMILRGDEPPGWGIVLHNALIKLGLILLAEGLARFLGQPRYSWIGISLFAVFVAFWSIAVTVDHDNIALRIHSSTAFTIIMMSMMCLSLMRDRTQTALLRWITIAVLAEYMAASLIQSIIEFRLASDFQSAAILADRNAWYLLQGTLFMIALFACLLFMATARLSANLREKNEALSWEVIERRRLENELSRSLEAERALREEQKDFMRVASHEFRTPLAIIRNAIDMIALTGEKSPEATKERIAGIGEALDRLRGLIDRFVANDQEDSYQPERVPLASLMADLHLHFEMTGQDERVHFHLADKNLAVFADPDMLATIVINVIDNALKYSPIDKPVHVRTYEDEDTLVIEVRDRGIGIPASEHYRIGRRFFRASNALETAKAGTGLGLYATHRLLSYHHGSLKLQPNGDLGTCATIRLPLHADILVAGHEGG